MSVDIPSRSSRLRQAEFAAAAIGCVLVIVALAIIWVARFTVHRELYVSELGAQGEPTAKWFQAALLFIVIGGSSIAWAGRGVHSRVRILSAWTPSVSLWIASGFFLVASQVTCTSGCPLPYGDSFTWQDFSHTSTAVLAFVAACWAMLQTSFAQGHRALVLLSRTSGLLVGTIAATGGLFSLFQFQVVLGSRLEFIATTLAIGWLVVFGAVLAMRSARALAPQFNELQLAPQEAKQSVG